MENPKRYEILEAMGDAAISVCNILIALTRAGYGASFNRIMKEYEELTYASVEEKDIVKSFKQDVYSKMCAYKKSGLVRKIGHDKNGEFIVTAKGKRTLECERIRLKLNFGIGLAGIKQNINTSNRPEKSIVVIFDIPEKMRWKRTWIRRALATMGLEIIQRSVWAGKTKMLKEFINDLKVIDLVDYVEIFYINKSDLLVSLNKK